jgi:membrane protein implicated in regulation of membrane protease activity
VPKHRRRYAAAPAPAGGAATPSTATGTGTTPLELALYGVLGAVVAAGVLLLGGQPVWQAITVVAIAVALLAVALRASTPSRHGRRRRH